MSEAHQLPITSPPDRDSGAPNGEQGNYDGPTGPFFVIDCEHFGERIFTKDSASDELSRGELIQLSKSTKDIGGVVLDLALRLELLPEDQEGLNEAKATVKTKQDEVEKIPWHSGSGHYDPEEANSLRRQTKELENIDILREAIRLRIENPVEKNQRVEMLVRHLVRDEVEYVHYDAVQYALWHLTTLRPKNQS